MTQAPKEAAWLFTRGNVSVHVRLNAYAWGLALFVSGPGSQREAYACADVIEAIHRQCQMEAALVRDGFLLERYTSAGGGLMNVPVAAVTAPGR